MNSDITSVVRGGSQKASCSNGFESVKDSVIASQRNWRGNLMTKPAFTLAEVLITLGIIGIVAALTIPALMQNIRNKDLVSHTLKVANVLSNAFEQAHVHDNITKLSEADFKLSLEKYFKKLAVCNDGYDVCMSDGSRYKYNNDFSNDCQTVVENGEGLAFKNACMSLLVDVNGKKGPNKAGKDLYTFWITKNGILPEGYSDTCDGLDCGQYVISHHKIWNGATTEDTPTEQPSEPAEETCNRTCDDGYYLTKACTCTKNSMCKSMDENGTCSVCSSNYYLSSNGVCVQNTGCTSSSGGKCTQCGEDSFLRDGMCVYNGGCTSSSDGQCTQCGEDSFLRDGMCVYNGGCTLSSDGECTQCSRNYFLKDGMCVFSGGCTSYLDGQCTQCNSGYTLIAGLCTKDDNEGCKSSSDGQCTKCSTHYILRDGMCVSNRGCKSSSDGQCTQCNANFILKDGVCVNISGCKSSSDGQCTQCIADYILKDGVCVNNRGCALYSDGECTQCSNNAFLRDGVCVENNGCTSSSDGKCTSCSSNYDLVDGVCESKN